MGEAVQEPRCPRCGEAMRLSRIVPRLAAHPELRSFECRSCREVVTETVE